MPLDSLDLSLDKVKEMRESLELFLEQSVVSGRLLSAFSVAVGRGRSLSCVCLWSRQTQQRLGLQLVKESPESLPGVVLLDFQQHLGSVLSRVEGRKDQLDVLVNLYEFYDSVSVSHC